MAFVQKSIEVNVPVRTAYNQWTQFESFPRFMQGVEHVQQLDGRRLRWRANLYGSTEEWDAVITEQIPDERIAWTNERGAENAGVVTFHRITDQSCRVSLQLEYTPSGFIESIGDALGFVSRQIEGDLERFKEFIERQGVESGAWRGTIEAPKSEPSPVGVASSTQTGSGAYSNRDESEGADWGRQPVAKDDVPAFGVGRSSSQNVGSDDARAAVAAGSETGPET